MQRKLLNRTFLMLIMMALVLTSVIGSSLPISDANADTVPSNVKVLPDPLTNPEVFKNPPQEVRPQFRWWWKSPLSEDETRREVEAIADAGFGGIEIAFDSSSWATQEQRDNLKVALETAAEKGVTMDMTMGANWPISTPNTDHGTGLTQQELMYGRVDLSGGEAFSDDVPAPIDDPENKRDADLFAVTAARVIEKGPATELLPPEEQPRWGNPMKVPDKSTILDPDSLVDLTEMVGSDGKLDWEAPEGDWILFAFWQRDTEDAVMNHFDSNSASAVGEYIDEHQIGADNVDVLKESGGAFFEDSLEFSAVSLYWSPQMAEEFQERRGYSMVKYLPLMYQHGMTNYWIPNPEEEPTPDFDLPTDEGEKIRNDYYRTLTDLYIDNHLKTFVDWAEDSDMEFKTQVAYGLALEPIRSARELTQIGGLVEDESFNSGDRIPWTKEANPMWRYALDHQRTLVSGTHQGGATRVSTEIGAQYFKTFEWNLGDYKGMMDKEWAAGITLPVLHGFQYQTGTASWPGDLRFGDVTSESWNDNFPQWTMFKPLTDYWARGTLVLEAGTPRTDVAIYRDGFLTTTARGRDPVRNEYTAPRQLFDAEAIERMGYSVQYIDPVGLTEPEAQGGGDTLYPSGPNYRAIVIDERSMPADSAEALAEFAKSGLAVVFVGNPPSKDTSYHNSTDGDKRVQKAIDKALKQPNVAQVKTQGEVAWALKELEVEANVEWSNPTDVYTQFRQTEKADYVYLYNASTDTVKFSPSFATTGKPYTMNLWTGAIDPVLQYSVNKGRITVPLELKPLETVVLAFNRSEKNTEVHVTSTEEPLNFVKYDDRIELHSTTSGTFDFQLSNNDKTQLATVNIPHGLPAAISPLSWDLHVEEFSPEGTVEHDLTLSQETLLDWRSLPELQGASGIGTYTGKMIIPEEMIDDGVGAYLDLGIVEGAVQVYLNGERVAPDSVAGRTWDVTDLLQKGENEVRIVLATTLRNAVTDKVGSSARTQAYGLIGPVQLIPYGRTIIHPDENKDPLSASAIKALVEQFEEDGEFANRGAARSLQIHLTAVERFEKRESIEKVIKHMNSFKKLLDHKKDLSLISEKAYNTLMSKSDDLIKKWQ